MIEESLHLVQQRMADAMRRAGRVDSALLVAVTKNHPVSAVEEVARLGVTHVGENRVQEAKEKQLTYNGPQLVWHLIGHLQVNKVRQAVPMFDLIHSVDSRKLLEEIEKVAVKHDKVQDVLLQVNVAREESKSGLSVEEFPEVRDFASTLPHVRVRGLMCMAPFYDNPEDARPIFKVANALYENMKRFYPNGQIKYLSMGMTHDFEVALEEGANIVRVGTAIFGERVYN
ncbi:MAG: YggS family pyridoxal phosphate-dependent enzyme [Veillonella sp.]|uniref:YggS family pyridoxal phosphate-dependent enzyme n=1 Tax=Veillonella sp. TaxID=1926307 RepID=UPI001B6EB002|nr:YggS family pyridoxal phosphate-dependent enzyme [Veillonella sp.]MBK7920821.1 YggS family pyridoxal phosphate-dependent enzyme [Veillonella sp.]MBP6923340.1 YggS family pyridoxal phosphate-dependent enzyme [Veillonella sp.]MBP8617100.1 YggS family pyridoxal phosphate-dependent enzyme [Veillonella sp.]MBP9516499.1 YggS family pyridoxal phosphate-dependent enzyme [Veillonella sp.]MBP9550423.1 YggS family pyridoxal phosphate-dependent enzyme [Veillonella sp.]